MPCSAVGIAPAVLQVRAMFPEFSMVMSASVPKDEVCLGGRTHSITSGRLCAVIARRHWVSIAFACGSSQLWIMDRALENVGVITVGQPLEEVASNLATAL